MKNNNEIIKYMTHINIVNIFLYNFLDQPIYPGNFLDQPIHPVTTSQNGIKDTPGIYINNCCPKFVCVFVYKLLEKKLFKLQPQSSVDCNNQPDEKTSILLLMIRP